MKQFEHVLLVDDDAAQLLDPLGVGRREPVQGRAFGEQRGQFLGVVAGDDGGVELAAQPLAQVPG